MYVVQGVLIKLRFSFMSSFPINVNSLLVSIKYQSAIGYINKHNTFTHILI